MSKVSLQDIQHLLREIILPFYKIKRDLPLPIENHRNENDAEHSWTLATVGIALAPLVDKNLDTGKVAKFALIHDLVELYAGDTSVWASKAELDTKSKREAEAIKILKKKLPQFPVISELIESYDSKDSNEALFIYALDKLIALLVLHEDNGYYYKKNKYTKLMFQKRFISHRKKAHSHPAIAKYYDQLTDLIYSHPDYFYLPK